MLQAIPCLDGSRSPKIILRPPVVRIIKARLEEILEMVRERLAASPFGSLIRRNVVLTGGASQLPGLAELASRILACPVRTGSPLALRELPDKFRGPAFAVVTGLLVYPQVAHLEHPGRRIKMMMASGGYFSRVATWLWEAF